MTAGGRWYPTLVALGDGRVFTVSGGPDHAEIYSSVTGWFQLPRQDGWPLYPHIFLMRNGHLFFTGGNVFAKSPAIAPGVLNLATNGFTNVILPADFDLGHRDHCASVMLAPAQDQMVMILGGGDPAINKSHVIDLEAAAPAYIATAAMHHARFHVNAVLFADRTVMVSGGNGSSEDAPTAVLELEIYHPDTNTWHLAAKAQVARMYHSIALLLPDGRVLAAGSNPNRRDDELRLEIFHPPYLFKGPRPFIEDARSKYYGSTIIIHAPQAREIKWVELIRPMATTHSCEPGQRIIDLPFETAGFCHIHARMPHEQNIAPPGWYMLFLVDHKDVPSTAKWVHLSGGKTPSHDPAFIREMIDMRMTGHEKPVPGTLGMDHDRHVTAKPQETGGGQPAQFMPVELKIGSCKASAEKGVKVGAEFVAGCVFSNTGSQALCTYPAQVRLIQFGPKKPHMAVAVSSELAQDAPLYPISSVRRLDCSVRPSKVADRAADASCPMYGNENPPSQKSLTQSF